MTFWFHEKFIFVGEFTVSLFKSEEIDLCYEITLLLPNDFFHDFLQTFDFTKNAIVTFHNIVLADFLVSRKIQFAGNFNTSFFKSEVILCYNIYLI